MTTRLGKRLNLLATRVPEGCPTCRHGMRIVIVDGDEPEPDPGCPRCGRVVPGIRTIRIVRVERGPM
jgi:hypothetical protein